MRRLPLLLLCVLLGGLAACVQPPRPAAAPRGPLILVSIDGFRWDYLDRAEAPTLRALAAGGVRARRMNPSFPTRTFPNHYTLVTGLRPARHGIVNNAFYDPTQAAWFNKGSTEPVWWEQGEPVWITAEKQGIRSAIVFWPGSEAMIQGRRPTRYRPFDQKVSSADRVDNLLAWLAAPPPDRPGLGVVYLDIVDIAAHTYGPEAPETLAAIREADDAVARLLAGLERLGLQDSANLVVVSDHGLDEISPDRVVFAEDVVDLTLATVEATGPHGGLRPKPGVEVDPLVASIRAKAPPPLQVYGPNDRPAHLHYDATQPRVPPILIAMDPGWCFEKKAGWPAFQRYFGRGNHGWDPAVPDMGALFVAAGPAFRRGVELPVVENLDVYRLLCAVLGLTPAPDEGSDALAAATLRR